MTGIPEYTGSSVRNGEKADFRKIKEIYESVVNDLKPEDVTQVKRLGQKGDKPRPILLRFGNLDMRKKLLTNNKNLKFDNNGEEIQVFVNIDRTREQNKKLYQLRQEKKRREASGETNLIIRNYKLLKTDARRKKFTEEFFRSDSSEPDQSTSEEEDDDQGDK